MHSTVSSTVNDGVRVGGEVGGLARSRSAREREAVLIVRPDAPDREGVRAAVGGRRDDPVVAVGGQLLGRPRPRQRVPRRRVDAVVGHVRTFGSRLGHATNLRLPRERPVEQRRRRPRCGPPPSARPRTATTIRRPSRVAEPSRHQPASVVCPLLIPSAPGIDGEQIVRRRVAQVVEHGVGALDGELERSDSTSGGCRA